MGNFIRAPATAPMDAGYTVADLGGIDLNSENESLYLVRMPQDLDIDQVIDLPIDKLFPGLLSTEDAQPSVTKNKLKAEMETDTSEVKIFRPITVSSVDGGTEVGPAFEGMVSITKEVVPQDINGGLQVKVTLPKSEILRIPISYAKKDQMPAVQDYVDRTARGAREGSNSERGSARGGAKENKKRKQAGEEAGSLPKRGKSKKKRD